MNKAHRRVPRVCCIIVNRNGRNHLEQCLPSLAAGRYPAPETIVVDNGSEDGSLLWLKDNFPNIETIALEQNVGFAEANNFGIRKVLSRGVDYIVLLNNDTRVEPDWLGALVATAEADPTVAICQARQRTWDGASEIRFRFIAAWAEAEWTCGPVEQPTVAAPTAFASGCAMLLRSSALERIGLFDERYFMYVEDVDLSLRAWIAGYRVMDVPAAIVYHRLSSTATDSRRRMYWGYRNQLTTMLKLYEYGTLRQFAGAMGRRWVRNRYAWRATLDAARMLPGTFARRRVVQAGRQASDRAFLSLSAT